MIITNLAHIAILSNTRRSVRIRAVSFTHIELKANTINFAYAKLCAYAQVPKRMQTILSICKSFLAYTHAPCLTPSYACLDNSLS